MVKRVLSAVLRGLVAASLLWAFGVPARGAAAAVTVGSGSPGSCTEAALDAALAGGGLITFDCGLGAITITLTTQKTISQDTVIDGGGRVVLNGGGTTRLFHVMPGVSLRLANLSLSDGNAGQGGAIYNEGTLTITASSLLNNDAPGGVGGAIYSTGEVTIEGSALSNNTAGAGIAGAVQSSGTLTVTDCDFTGNFGGLSAGAISSSGSLTIANSRFTSNTSANYAGAIYSSGPLTISGTTFVGNGAGHGRGGAVYSSGTLTLTDGVFQLNTASMRGGGIYNDGTATIVGSAFVDNASGSGGAIYNAASVGLYVERSTFTGNDAPGGTGGGIDNEGTLVLTAVTMVGNTAGAGLGGAVASVSPGDLTVTNCTFSDNFGVMSGGGILASGAATVRNSTIYGNGSGGIVNGGTATVSVVNTIVAGNTPANCIGTIFSLGHNLESADSCGFAAAGDLSDTDPLLLPLANSGGPVLTHDLLSASPAIDAGSLSSCSAQDARGVARPQFGACDIGAVEFVMRTYLPMTMQQ
ncbi:MAG: choice-of-anchor Q domain-containing protein [Anaerolineae bacterium]